MPTEIVGENRPAAKGFSAPGPLPFEPSGKHIVHVAYKLLRLFETGTGRNRRCSIGEALPFALPFLRGSLRFSLNRIPAAIMAEVGRRPLRDTNGESGAHREMKAAAILWMKSQGARDARDEASCFVGRADAFSESQRWAVECGNTSITKLDNFICARQHDPGCRLTIIPYQRNGFDEAVRGLLAVDIEVTQAARLDLAAYSFAMVDGFVGTANAGRRPKGYRAALSRLNGRAGA